MESTFKEADNNHDEQTLETLRKFQDVSRKKLLSIKNLENEIISIIDS